MRFLICGLVVIVLMPAATGAQKIRGAVVEDGTGRPISVAKIELLAPDTTLLATAISSATGWFELTPQSAGQFLVRASHTAYRSTVTIAVDFRTQEIMTVVLRLSGGPIPLEPLVVNATALDRLSGYRERARRGAFGRFITRADIDKLGGYNLAHVLRFTPEVHIERLQSGPFTTEGVFMRSFGGSCVPAVYLDGLPVPTDGVLDINSLISAEAIEGIEVYRSSLSAPMELRSLSAAAIDLSGCGVIAVWSLPLPGARLTAKRVAFAGLLVGLTILVARISR